jgi:hypothetical protein
MGLSRKCVRTWVTRYETEGETGLVDRSSRPHHCPTVTSPQACAAVVAARQELRCVPDGLAEATGVPVRTVSRILVRAGMPRLAQLDRISGELIRSSKQTAVRYERVQPGELVHMDVKKLGRIPNGGGWRVHGRAGAEPIKRKQPVGYDYVHSLIDDHSRLAYSEVLGDEKRITCAAFLTRAATYFANHGITRIERLMTDNAWAYHHSLKAVCVELGTTQKFIRPHCPWQKLGDDLLDDGVSAVDLVGGHRVQGVGGGVGDERVVAVGGEQLTLGATVAGRWLQAAHSADYEPAPHVLGLTASGERGEGDSATSASEIHRCCSALKMACG